MKQVLIDRATLEQLVRMLEQCLDDTIQVQCDLEQGYSKSLALAQMVQVELSKEALTAGRAALAQQDDSLQTKYLKSELAHTLAQHGEQRCTYCDGTGDVHSIDGEWRGTCHCAAAPAPQPAQGESLNLAREVLKLNALWNKSTVQAPEISDQLGICRVLAERVNTDD